MKWSRPDGWALSRRYSALVRQLLLMRHGKSDWDADYGPDHDRPLSRRGVRSARLMGRMLAESDLAPDHVISSSAVRALSTAQLAAESGRWTAEVVANAGLYETGVDSVLGFAAEAPDISRLMLVGHQPTWSMLVRKLTGAFAEMKTASVAVIDLPIGRWAELPESGGALISLYHPRPFFGSEWDEPGSKE